MATSVKSVRETWPDGAGGQWDLQTIGDDQQECSRTFVVIFNQTGDELTEGTPNERLQDARTANDGTYSVPTRGSRLSTDPASEFYNLYAKDYQVESTANLFVFLVIVTYQNETADWDPNASKPWVNAKWTMNFPNKVDQEVIDTCLLTPTEILDPGSTVAITAGSENANAAGQVFDPPPRENVYPMIYNMVKAFADADGDTWVGYARAYRGKLNDANVTLCGQPIDKHYGRILSISVDPAFFNGERYWNVQIQIEQGLKPYYRTWLNKGNYYLDDTDNDKEVYPKDAGKRTTNRKRWLDKDGHAFTDGVTGDVVPNYRVAGLIFDNDWSVLGLPNSLAG